MKLHGLLQKCSFFFRFDWTLAARGGAHMKLHRLLQKFGLRIHTAIRKQLQFVQHYNLCNPLNL